MASSRRVNTLTLNFAQGSKKPDHFGVHQLIRDQLKFKEGEIKGIQMDNIKSKVYIKLESKVMVQKSISDNNGLVYFTDSNNQRHPVELTEEEPETFMKIYDFPIEMSNEKIKLALGKFGIVKSIRNDVWRGEGFYKVENGIRSVIMKLNKPVPSYVRVEGYTSLVTYHGQPRTCMICDLPGHVRKDCPKQIQKRIEQIRRPPVPLVLAANSGKSFAEVTSNRSGEECSSCVNEVVPNLSNIEPKEQEKLLEDEVTNPKSKIESKLPENIEERSGKNERKRPKTEAFVTDSSSDENCKLLKSERGVHKVLKRENEKGIAICGGLGEPGGNTGVDNQEMEFSEDDHEQFTLPSESSISYHGDSFSEAD